MEQLEVFFNQFGLAGGTLKPVVLISVLFLVVLLCFVTALFTRILALKIIYKLVKRSKNTLDDALVKNQVFRRLSHLVPAAVLYLSAGFLGPLAEYVQRFSLVYMSLAGIFSFSALLNAFLGIYATWEISKERPIKSYIQSFKIIFFSVGFIFVLATVLDRSPWKFISGLGAISAILILVFKDTLLGLMAGFQLSLNRMINIGDWIEMPKYQADGDVTDISLTTVKVQNWDKTITTIPTYALVSDSFRNWRGMSESGGRRIKRAIHIDMTSIHFCSNTLLAKLRQIQILQPYIQSKADELEKHNQKLSSVPISDINHRRLTNVGLFRAYLLAYLRSLPKVNRQMTLLVRHLQPSDQGLPIELYLFSSDKVWANYESLQADIFDHLIAILPEFELRAFQKPSGYDWLAINQR